MNEFEWQLLEDKHPAERVEISGIEIKVGSRVRLRPRKGGDILDIALAGQCATIEAIEQDYEGKAHVCVVLDDDPGRDLGFMRQPGHRFFFNSEEIEPMGPSESNSENETAKPTVLIACIGNIFLGDDGFGVEVAKRLATRSFPRCVHLEDFGIRGLDLTYALQSGYDSTILVDAHPHGASPGTLYVIEPDLKALDASDTQQAVVDAHSMNPLNVLLMAKAMNAELKNVFLVGCEPATLGGDEGQMGLSEAVEGSLDEAVSLIVSLVERVLQDKTKQGIS